MAAPIPKLVYALLASIALVIILTAFAVALFSAYNVPQDAGTSAHMAELNSSVTKMVNYGASTTGAGENSVDDITGTGDEAGILITLSNFLSTIKTLPIIVYDLIFITADVLNIPAWLQWFAIVAVGIFVIWAIISFMRGYSG